MIKNIIFDFGGVILKHKATLTEDILHEMFPDSYKQAEDIWKIYQPLIKTGKKTSHDFITELKNNIQTQFSVEELENKWRELYKKEADNVDWGLLSYIDALKKNYKVYLFTDTIDIHDEYNRTRNIYEHFHKVFKSFEEGIAKVEGKLAYLYILKKIEAKPDECIIIDDREDFVLLAREVGIDGIVYKNLEQLEKDLRSNLYL